MSEFSDRAAPSGRSCCIRDRTPAAFAYGMIVGIYMILINGGIYAATKLANLVPKVSDVQAWALVLVIGIGRGTRE
jgi:hypothetical protein